MDFHLKQRLKGLEENIDNTYRAMLTLKDDDPNKTFMQKFYDECQQEYERFVGHPYVLKVNGNKFKQRRIGGLDD